MRELRQEILEFIGDFANWNESGNPRYFGVSRLLVQSAYENDIPLFLDPFAGGRSIPLEALRIGCDAFSTDINPVACLLQTVILEGIPRHGPELAADLLLEGEKNQESI